jgi:hypothetical protein
VLAPPPVAGEEAVEAAVETAAALLRAARRGSRTAFLCAGGARAALPVADERSLSSALDALARFRASGEPAPAPPADARPFVLDGGPVEGLRPARSRAARAGAVA